ncbi:MAG: tetratricopeptide repeat protein, partial [Chitinivibrionales bacterium]
MLEVKEIKKVPGSCLVLIALLFSFAEGYDEDNTFTGGFSSPYLQADYIQNLTEHSAALINPALIWRVNQLYAEAGYFNWGWGVADVEETQSLYYIQGTFLVPLRLRHTAGVSLIGANSTIDKTILDTQTKTVSTQGGSLSWYEWWITFHYCYKIFPWLTVGANPKVVIQNQFDEAVRGGFGLDMGVYGTVFDHYRFGDLGLSLSFIDLIPAHVEWEGSEEKQQMTTRMRAGFRYKGLNERLVIAYDVNIDNIFAGWQNILDGQTTIIDTTVDTTVTPYDTTIVEKDMKKQLMDRVGRYSAHAKFEVMPQLWVKGGWGNNNIPYIGFNFNVLYPMVQSINKFEFDFHIGYSLNETERGFTLMSKVSSLFGPTREQRESRRLHDKLMLAPRDAYNKAMRLYSAGKYWEASYAFGKVLTLYPNFHLNDKAAYYMGDSYSELRLNNIARKVFEEALDEYSTSDMRADYLYGLERLDYREGKFKSALKNHAFISNLYPDDEIASDAHYIAGEIHFKRGNYSTAKELFLKVKPEAESYIYAQYSLSVINVIKKKKKAAITNLENIFADTSSE